MTIAHKRAALQLHQLSSRDREWVLSRLAPVEQARVKPLLAELEAMNIRFEVDGDAKPAASSGDDMPVVTKTKPSARSLLREASAADVARVLSHEPAWLVDAVLAIEAWPWANSVRHSLGHKASGRTDAGRQTMTPIAPALANTLVAAIAERLHGASDAPINGVNGHGHALNGVGIWRRVWPKVRQWLP